MTVGDVHVAIGRHTARASALAVAAVALRRLLLSMICFAQPWRPAAGALGGRVWHSDAVVPSRRRAQSAAAGRRHMDGARLAGPFDARHPRAVLAGAVLAP
jgi:hypothetical protein